MIKSVRKFFPVHRDSTDLSLSAGQRYRFSFNDKRLAHRVDKTIDLLVRRHSQRIDSLSLNRKDSVATYRLLDNDKIDCGELINYCCNPPAEKVIDNELLVLGDGSTLNVNLNGHGARASWAKQHSCLVNSKVAGFQFMAGLVVDQQSHDIIGLSDLMLYDSPRDLRSQKKRHGERRERLKLPLEERESGSWTILADNSIASLPGAKRITFVFDREADSYENMTHLMQKTGGDFIIRQKYNRKASEVNKDKEATLSDLLEGQQWVGEQHIKLAALNHYNTHKRKKRLRKKRKAKLKIRYIHLDVAVPKDYYKFHHDRPVMKEPLYLVEVLEDESTVPAGEKPVHWKMWTTWKVEDIKTAWQVVDAYRARWNVEQLFRLLKTDGINLEDSQLNHPDRIKRLLIMSTKASVNALKLVQARSGEHFTAISEMFSEEEQGVLKKLNGEVSTKGSSVHNPHAGNSLAFAAWIIARLGGWNGYESQRPPGPIKMHRGLKRFYEITKWKKLFEEE